VQTLETLGKPKAEGGGTPDFGLSPRALGLLRELIATYPEVHRAIVYGSRAMGSYRNGSDIDITLDAPRMENARFLHLCTAADDLMLPWMMDLSLLSHISNPALLEHINRVGKPLWVRPDIPPTSSAQVSAQMNAG
jgi:predicted nucleotidyltransferase